MPVREAAGSKQPLLVAKRTAHRAEVLGVVLDARQLATGERWRASLTVSQMAESRK